MTNRPWPEPLFGFQLPHCTKARVVPFREENQMFMQDIGSTADTEFSRKDLALRWRELRVEVLQALSAYWKLVLFPRGFAKNGEPNSIPVR
jgi:hypothetical protein